MSKQAYDPFHFIQLLGSHIIAKLREGNQKIQEDANASAKELIEAQEKDSELTLEQMLELSRQDNLEPQFLLFRKKKEKEGGNGYNAFLYFWDLYQKLLAIRDKDLELGRDPKPIIRQIIRFEAELGLN